MHTADSRFETPWRLFQELIPHLLIVLIAYFATTKKLVKEYVHENRQTTTFFFAIGLSAILPLMLTMVQKGWYMVPGFPYLGIGFATLLVPFVHSAIKNIKTKIKFYKAIQVVSVILLLGCFAFIFAQKGKIHRHQDMVEDVYKISKIVPKFSIITVPDNMYEQYNFVLQGFLVRYFNISISPYEQYEYYLIEKGKDVKAPNNYALVNVDLSLYELYEKEKE